MQKYRRVPLLILKMILMSAGILLVLQTTDYPLITHQTLLHWIYSSLNVGWAIVAIFALIFAGLGLLRIGYKLNNSSWQIK